MHYLLLIKKTTTMEKKLTSNVLDRLIREAIEDQKKIDMVHFDKDEFPEFFDEFLGTLGQDFLGYDYPSSPEEEADQFDIFMRYNHPDEAPSAQSQVGYSDAESTCEIGDGLDDDLLNGLGLNESVVRHIARHAVNEVLKEYNAKNKKPAKKAKQKIANLYPGKVIKRGKK